MQTEVKVATTTACLGCREITSHHAGEKLDPRAAIAGRTVSPLTPSSEPWVSGLFDKGSWIETQAGWARSVVTGRARLGGIAVGVIAVETQTVMLNIPADPGAPDSSERIIPQVCPYPLICTMSPCIQA